MRPARSRRAALDSESAREAVEARELSVVAVEGVDTDSGVPTQLRLLLAEQPGAAAAEPAVVVPRREAAEPPEVAGRGAPAPAAPPPAAPLRSLRGTLRTVLLASLLAL